MTIVLDGDEYPCISKAVDHTAAEVVLARDGGSMEKTPVTAGFRVAFATFRRNYPDAELAGSFSRFLEALEDIRDDESDDAGDEAPGMLDPIRPVDSDV
jgi:hypothetical protein